jgi:hypothetical protein
VIGDPLNDHDCLELITDHIEDATGTAAVRDLATRFRNTGALADWIRGLPQRNDDGRSVDGPRVACDVPQRLRLPADDPNCVERSALYIAAAEHLDSRPIRRLATIATPLGRHTFPVEDEAPINLDPRLPRNALSAGLYRILGDEDEVRNAQDALDWVLSLAEEPAASLLGGLARLRNAEVALEALELGERLPRNAAEDIGFALALADDEAPLFGPVARNAVATSDRALRRLLSRSPRNRFGIKIGGSRIEPNWGALESVHKIAERVGKTAGKAYVRYWLGGWGLSPEVIGAVENELKAEGLSLGALADPPPKKGSLEALTTSALLKRRLQNK